MFVGASEKAQKLQECFTSESKLKIGKVESDDKTVILNVVIITMVSWWTKTSTMRLPEVA